MYVRRIIANGYGLDGPGIESRGCEVFRARQHLPRGPPSLLYNGYWVSFLGVKRPGCGADHTPPSSSAEVLNGLELYLRLPFLPEQACYCVIFTFTYVECIKIAENFLILPKQDARCSLHVISN